MMPINLEQLRQIAQGKRNAPLVAGVRVSVTSAIRLGGMEVVDPKRFPLVEIRARADACPFCAAMNRKVFRKDAFNAYLPPFHINCRCVVVHLQEGVAQENFDPSEVEPLLRHAHFVADRIRGREVRYEALQIPARVEGRDFIFRRVKDPTTGRWVRKLEFRQGELRMVQFQGMENLLPPEGERPKFDLKRIGRAIRQLKAAYNELFVRADIRRVYVLAPSVGQRRNWKGQVNPYSGTVFLNPVQIEKGNPSIGVFDPTDQFLLTLVEELVHPKVQIFAERHPTKWERYTEKIWQGTHPPILLPLFKQGEHPNHLWRRNKQEWVTKALATVFAGRGDLLVSLPFEIDRLWEEVK